MKRGKHPTSSTRNCKQKVKATYAKAREDAQLAGVIPTEPVGAVRDERVPSSAQSTQPLVELINQAIRNGWAVPEVRKPELIDELLGIVNNADMPAKVKVAAFNALRQADQAQWERDHPKEKESAQGPLTLNVNVVTVLPDDGNKQDDTSLPEATPVLGE